MKPFQLPRLPDSGSYSALDPLDSRYFDPEVSKYLSEESRIAFYAYVEAALAHTLADFGICSKEAALSIGTASRKVDAAQVYAEEKVTNHHTKALVNAIKNHLDDKAKPFVHFGATSFDIICTAESLQLRMVTTDVIVPRLQALQSTLITLAEKYVETVQIGRTHGQHGVPITFGLAMAVYVSRLGETIGALRDLSGMLTGKFSGAVGAYNALSIFIDDPVKFEKSLLAKLDLKPSAASTQIVPAEGIIRLLDELTIAAGIMANLAHDMRHLQRTEIAEVQEKFEKGQTGSSTMAHKRNPWNFENVISMQKQVQAQMLNANLNISSEHQRDLTDSASSRFYGVAVACVAAMAQRLNKVMAKLEVNEAAMQRNLQLTGGAIAAEPFYLLLEKYGHTEAHELSKELAHNALAEGKSLKDVITGNSEGAKYWQKFSSDERNIIQDPAEYYIGKAAEKTRTIITRWKN